MTAPEQHHDSFTIERVYKNCRDHVWSAWATPEKKSRWFGAEFTEMDFRPGGVERLTFTNDMGEHANETRYFEIREGERIVYAYSMSINGRVHTVSLATVVFMDENGGTRLQFTEQMCVIPPSDGVDGRKHGWNALLDALGDYVAGETG